MDDGDRGPTADSRAFHQGHFDEATGQEDATDQVGVDLRRREPQRRARQRQREHDLAVATQLGQPGCPLMDVDEPNGIDGEERHQGEGDVAHRDERCEEDGEADAVGEDDPVRSREGMHPHRRERGARGQA